MDDMTRTTYRTDRKRSSKARQETMRRKQVRGIKYRATELAGV